MLDPCIAQPQFMFQQVEYLRYTKKTVYQYSETNVTHFLFSLLRIKDLYMFRTIKLLQTSLNTQE
jgi:hypothetical protein